MLSIHEPRHVLRSIFFFCLVAFLSNANATIRYVDSNGGANHYSTINAAYTAAVNGDTILISSGNYQETITSAKRLTFVGAGFGQTMWSNPQSTICLTLASGSSQSVVEGLRIINRENSASTSCLRLEPNVDSLVIRRCYLKQDNYFDGYDCIQRNASGGRRVCIEDCILHVATPSTASCYTFALIRSAGDDLSILNCLFARQSSQACTLVTALRGSCNTLSLRNSTFVGFGKILELLGSNVMLISNNVSYDWASASIATWGTVSGQANWDYNASSGVVPPGTNAILLTQNPFVNYNTTNNYVYGTSDLHLNNVAGGGAACIDAGDPVQLDLDGSRSDLGIYGGQTPFIDSGAPNYPFVQSLTVPPSVTVGNQLQIQSQGRIGRGY